MSRRNNDITKGASRVAPTASGLLAVHGRLFICRGELHAGRGQGIYLFTETLSQLMDAIVAENVTPDPLMISPYFLMEWAVGGRIVVSSIWDNGEATDLPVGEVYRQQMMRVLEIPDGIPTNPPVRGLVHAPKKGALCN